MKMPKHFFPPPYTKEKYTGERAIKNAMKKIISVFTYYWWDYKTCYDALELIIIQLKQNSAKYYWIHKYQHLWTEYMLRLIKYYTFPVEDFFYLMDEHFNKFMWEREVPSYQWTKKDLALERFLLNKWRLKECFI